MFERGDLLLVPFPFSDLSATKRRPVDLVMEGSVRNPFIQAGIQRSVEIVYVGEAI